MHVMMAPVAPASEPCAVRVHICPELPDQIEEMQLAEDSEWGLAKRVGESQVLSLYQVPRDRRVARHAPRDRRVMRHVAAV